MELGELIMDRARRHPSGASVDPMTQLRVPGWLLLPVHRRVDEFLDKQVVV